MDNNMNYDKAKIYSANKILVHITKKNGTFYNGLITEVSASGDFFFIEDLKEGRRLVLFSELNKEITEYKEP